MTSRKKDLPARLIEHARLSGLFSENETVLVAVSGGADSMVLLHCLITIRPAFRLNLTAAHVDHGLRASSGDDAAFVEACGHKFGVKVVVRKADVRAVARERGQTLEEAAREVRYSLLAEAAREMGIERIATGHTATDQAETVLMRLIRGTGPAGLAGIEPSRQDGFIRPLLCATRDEVRRYARERRIPFLEDPMNRDRRFLRNRIRATILPALRRINPRIEFALSDLANDARHLSAWIERVIGEAIEFDTDRCLVAEPVWRGTSHALRPYLILKAFQRLTQAPLGLSRTHVQAVLRIASSEPSSRAAVLYLPRGVTVRWDKQGLLMTVGKSCSRDTRNKREKRDRLAGNP